MTNKDLVAECCKVIRGIAMNYPQGMGQIGAEVERVWPRQVLGSTPADREREHRYQAHKDEFERTVENYVAPLPAPPPVPSVTTTTAVAVGRGPGRPRKVRVAE